MLLKLADFLVFLKKINIPMAINVKFGSEIINLDTPANFEVLETRHPEYTIDKATFTASLQELLRRKKRDYSDVAIVVSDKTRLCGYELYLPWLLEILSGEGVDKDHISFYIAYGTHPKQSDQESLKSYGDTFLNYRFIHHDPNDESVLSDLGTTSRGTRILIRKDVLDSSLIITFGAISHHYFAAYGGGRKLLFPGLAARESVYQNHSLFLNFREKKLEEGCRPGNLDGNPLSDDLKEIDDLLPEKISIHGILDNQGKVCQLHPGESYGDFLKACSLHDSFYRSGLSVSFDMVVASSGGYPKDINFIQGHKSVHHAAAFVKDGGKLLIFSECRDGIGNTGFLPLFREGGPEAVYKKLETRYEGNGGTALAMMAKTSRISIHMVTDLDEETCKLLDVHKTSFQEAQDLIHKNSGTIAFIPNASMLVK